MEELALTKKLVALEASRSSLDHWLTFFIFLVVIGLAVELVVICLEHRHETLAFERGVPERPSSMVLIFALLGAGLVALGVSGEFGIHIKSERLETEIRKVDSSLLTIANRKAGDARASAEGAALAASRANDSAGSAQQRSAAVAEQADELTQQLKRTELNLGITQALISARRIENPNELVEQLRQFSGQTVIITSYVGDEEGWGLCSVLVMTTGSAGMKPVDLCGKSAPAAPMVNTVAISGPDIDETLKLGSIITQAGHLGTTSGIKAPTLNIFVGVKAPFSFGGTTQIPDKRKSKKP
jgi:hypothetical protein